MAEATLTQKSGLVTYTIKVEGAENQKLEVLAVSVSSEINKIPVCRITIKDGDAALQDFIQSGEGKLVPGKKIEVLGGYNSEDKQLFKGVIIKHSIKARQNRTSTLTIECKDEAVKLTSGRFSRYFYESSDSDIIDEILGEYGLSTDVEKTDVTHAEMVQYLSSDWDFINTRAEVNGKVVIVKDGKVIIRKPDDGKPSKLLLEYGNNILEFEAEIDARNQWKAVSSSAWDPATQAMVKSEGKDSKPRELGSVKPADLSKAANNDSLDFIHAGQVSDEELGALADSKLLKSRLSKVKGWVKFQGVQEVEVGQFVELAGLGDSFIGDGFISGVQHEFGNGNWFTTIQLGCDQEWFYEGKDVNPPAALGLLPSVSGLHIGVVTQLEADPDSEERIMVKVPGIDPDEDGIWARIATLDAGNNRGSIFRPEIDDEVIVGYLDDDPRNPIVLGMLHSSKNVSPIPAADDNHEKGFVSRGDMRILFNDEVNSLEISTPNGNKLLFSEEEGSITAEDENGNKLEMTADGITIDSSKDLILKAAGDVTIEGVNIDSNASAEFKAEGGAGAELSSGATAVLKGSLVQIN